MFTLDHDKMREMAVTPPRKVTATDLCRDGRAFFVGGALPIQETLETMFESHCEASTDLFVVTVEGRSLRHGIEMVRSLKKNFNMRLMVRLDYPFSESVYAQIYAAGADLAEISLAASDHAAATAHTTAFAAARTAFPRWSVASALMLDETSRLYQVKAIDELLDAGIVPLPRLLPNGTIDGGNDIAHVLQHLVKAWRHHKVSIKPYAAVICVNSPLVLSHKPGTLRTLFDRLHYRRELAASDLLRHLRVSAPTDSLDSAGL